MWIYIISELTFTENFYEIYFSFFYRQKLDEQPHMFDSFTWPADTVTIPIEQTQVPPPPPPIPTSANTTSEFSPLLTLLLPMMNSVEPTPPPPQPKPSAIIFSSNNGVIDDPLIQSLAAEQAASAHNYDLFSYRHKRVSSFAKDSSVHYYNRFDVHYVMVINQLARQIFIFYLVNQIFFLYCITLSRLFRCKYKCSTNSNGNKSRFNIQFE